MHGKHDYNTNPFAPFGCDIKMHILSNKRKTWEEHTNAGFYIGTLWDHYHLHALWITYTKNTEVGQTVFFKHKYLTQPTMTSTNAILCATHDLYKILTRKQPVKGETRHLTAGLDPLVNRTKINLPANRM